MPAATSRIERIAAWSVIGLVVASAVHGTVALRGLYADGAYYFWAMLQNEGYFLFDPARGFAQFVTQIPAVVAIAAGVDDVGILAVLQSAGVAGAPTLLWAGALALLVGHRMFWPMVVVFAAVFLNSGFVAIGEYTVLYGLVAVAVALLVRPRFGVASALALLVIAVLTLRTYEAAVYLAPLLAVLALVRWRQLRDEPVATGRRVTLIASAGLFVFAAVLGGLAIVFPRDPMNRQGAADLLAPILSNRELVIVGAIATCYLVARLVLKGRALLASSIVLSVIALGLLLPSVWAQPWMHYHARTITGLAMLALLLLALVPPRRAPEADVSPAVWVLPVVLLLAQLVPFTVHTQGYRAWLATFEQELDARSGTVRFEDTALLADSSTYAWPWTNPFLSIVLRERDSSTLIVSPGADPAATVSPADLPDRFVR